MCWNERVKAKLIEPCNELGNRVIGTTTSSGSCLLIGLTIGDSEEGTRTGDVTGRFAAGPADAFEPNTLLGGENS